MLKKILDRIVDNPLLNRAEFKVLKVIDEAIAAKCPTRDPLIDKGIEAIEKNKKV
mgnify:CR=1 FL=1